MSRFILALCTGTLALGLALALPTSSQAAVPVNVAPVTAVQPVGYCYPRVYYPYGSWRSHHHYHHRYHHGRHWR